jgi:hypothetical protein
VVPVSAPDNGARSGQQPCPQACESRLRHCRNVTCVFCRPPWARRSPWQDATAIEHAVPNSHSGGRVWRRRRGCVVVAPDPSPRLIRSHGHGPKQFTTTEGEPFRHLREEPNIAPSLLEELLMFG